MAKVLVVEDEEQLRLNISEQLELDNHEVGSAMNGAEALALLSSFTPDLILCDIMMPEMDGIEFIRAIKRSVLYRSIPLIFLTAKVSQQDMLQGLEEGAIDYLQKPFLHKELLLKVNNIINQQKDLLIHQLQKTVASEEADFQFIRQFTEQLERNFANSSFTIDQMAEAMNMSLSTLQRNLKRYFQRGFGEIIREYRLLKAAEYLIQTDQSLQWIASRCGFSSLSYFSSSFKEANQISPLRFRQNNQSNGLPT
ncbi:response regulator [Spirosoma soli]|uniref:Response regulator n=1 Tax=Spirosoma soli TaxID=1770529 RepID=A0ABW5LZK5_9BACT